MSKCTLLSLPPDASSWWSVLHFKPHTSCLCPCSRFSDWRGGVRTSLWRIIRSRLPEDNWSAFQVNAPANGHKQNKVSLMFNHSTLSKDTVALWLTLNLYDRNNKEVSSHRPLLQSIFSQIHYLNHDSRWWHLHLASTLLVVIRILPTLCLTGSQKLSRYAIQAHPSSLDNLNPFLK